MCKKRTIHALNAIKSDEHKYVIEVDNHANLETLKEKLSSYFKIPSANLKLIHAGHEIFDEGHFEQLRENPLVLHVADRQRPATEADRPPPRPPTRPLVSVKYLYAWCLLANVKECLRCVQLDPPNRLAKVRLSVAPTWTVFTNGGNLAAVPTVSDYAHLVEMMSSVFEQLSEECKKNAELIQSMDSSHSPNQLTLRNRLQLVFDASRYMAVLNQQMSCFIVPLNESSPRLLSFRQNPVAASSSERSN